MANRTFSGIQALAKQVKVLSGKITIGGSGAVSSVTSKCGFTAAKTATGQITVTLEDKYNALLGADVTLLRTSFAATRAELKSESVSSGSLIIHTGDMTTGEADLASGTVMLVTLVLKNTDI